MQKSYSRTENTCVCLGLLGGDYISENDEDYSDYRQLGQNTLSILALLSGFTFTGITILLSQFPVLGSLAVQFILLFLASLFFLFMFLLAWSNAMAMRRCRKLPPVTREIAGFNRLTTLSYVLLQLAVVLMFLVWNLVYLSLASGVVLAMFVLVYDPVLKMGRLREDKDEQKSGSCPT